MRSVDWLQLVLFVAALALITKPMGLYLMRVLDANGRTWLDPVVKPLERLTYWLMGVQSAREQNWKEYTFAMLLFSLVSCLFTYGILRLQHLLPLNPQRFGPMNPDLAFNTAVSFTTNTNWQNYGGESTLSYLSQMVGLTIHNFASAAVGIAIAAALVRGIARHSAITLGNRMATEFLPAPGIAPERLADAAQLASLADETPEGRSVVVLAKQRFNLRAREVAEPHAKFVPFTAQTRMSGVDFYTEVELTEVAAESSAVAAAGGGRRLAPLSQAGGVQSPSLQVLPELKPIRGIRKGAADAMRAYVEQRGGSYPEKVSLTVEEISRSGGTPLVVTDGSEVLGVIQLKDVVKGGIKERFAQLRKMGIRTVMITGDNPQTAAAIAAEAGVDDFLAQATPEAKLKRIRSEQAEGHLVAMTGDGTNDAPALAQADVGVAMNTGTQAAREAGNMVDLDSNPTKLIEIVEIGKQLLITRGSLTTFSIANDVAKYFAIIPAMLMATFPAVAPLNIMHLHSPTSAILSAVIFNALIIIALIPLALRGVAYKPIGALAILQRNLLIYGLGGVIVPFVGIKLIDLLTTALHLV